MKTGRPPKRITNNEKSITQNWLRVISFSFFVFCSSFLFAADLQVSASLDHNQVSLNEQAILSLTISGSGELPAPQLPGLADFQIYNAGREQNFSWINGQASASTVYRFVLTALKTGHFTIPPIRVESQGKSVQTQPLELDVVAGDASAAAAPAAGQASEAPSRANHNAAAVFITGTVDKTPVYVGEPVTYSFRLYNRVPLMSRPNYQPPTTSGFWSEDLPPQRNYTTQIKGVPYSVTEVQTALFPTNAGQAHIGAASLGVSIENFGSDPFSNNFFAQFFGQAEQKVLRTDPVTVHVKSLPDPKPAGFKGAVGHYAISAAMDKDTVSVGQPMTLTMTISGTGNIKSIPELTLPALTNFRTFDANAATNIQKKEGHVQGSKVFKTVLIPTASGELKIPSIPFVYFDSETRSYRTISTRAFSVRILPGSGGASAAPMLVATSPGAPPATPGIQMLGDDIRYIETPSHIADQGPPLYRRRWFLILQGLLLLGLAAGILFKLYERLFLSDRKLWRFKTALSRAVLTRRKSEKAMDENQIQAAAGLLSDTLHDYLADKLSLDSAGLPLRTVMDELRARGLPVHTIEKVRNLWETIDLFEFAPAQVRVDELRQVDRTLEHVIEELEKQIPWKS